MLALKGSFTGVPTQLKAVMIARTASTKAAAGAAGVARASGLPAPITRLRTLPALKTSLLVRDEDVDTWLDNSKRRKGAFKDQHAIRLKELRDLILAENNKASIIQQKQRQISDSIEEYSRELGKLDGEEKTKKQVDLKTMIADAQKLKHTKQEHEVKAETAEYNTIWALLPNLTSGAVRSGDIRQAILSDFGGDLDLVPEAIRSCLKPESKGKTLAEINDVERAAPLTAQDHVEITNKLGWFDATVSNTVTGPSWPFLVGPLANLEHALVNYAIAKGVQHGFTSVCVPDVVKRDILSRTGFAPREDEAGQTYWITADGKNTEKEDPSDLALAATSEIALAGLLAGATFKSEDLPLQMLASSHAFRAEAGARGQESRGLYRVHQFTKVELFVACRSSESEKWLERLVAFQKEVVNGLGLPYRVLDMPTEELGASAYRKFDVEAWMPGRGSWGEISSASNCTDYQAKRLHIKSQATGVDKIAEGLQETTRFVHTLNGTAIAVPRVIVALLENYGVDGANRPRLPSVLKSFWPQSDVANVEWLAGDDKKLSQPSAMKRSLDRVRDLAQRNGSDPASMVASFLILHELTAIVPVVLLFYILGLLGVGDQVMGWLLDASTEDGRMVQEDGYVHKARVWLRAYIDEGMQRAERYGRRKGWFGFEEGSKVNTDASSSLKAQSLAGTFANAVAAYAIVKILLPVRLAACFALTAPFARLCFEPLKHIVRRGGKAAVSK
jgi:seryl-tRNA synthetase